MFLQVSHQWHSNCALFVPLRVFSTRLVCLNVSLYPHQRPRWHVHPQASTRCSWNVPTAQHAILPSFPTLIHQATQIFSRNPPFARTALPPEFSNMIWSDEWNHVPSNIARSRVSRLHGSNKMSCFPFGPLMPLWASFCRSLMCHNEIVALDSNPLVDLELTGRGQTPSPKSPIRPGWGNPGVGRYWDVFLCLSVVLRLAL